MKITVESTSKMVTLDGVPARIWEGQTESGIKCHCYITRIAIDKDEPRLEEFERELSEKTGKYIAGLSLLSLLRREID